VPLKKKKNEEVATRNMNRKDQKFKYNYRLLEIKPHKTTKITGIDRRRKIKWILK
jgi:hypothetical protein